MNKSEAGKLGWEKTKEKHFKRHRQFKLEYYKKNKRCPQCNKRIPYEKRHNKYCDHSCAAKTSNTNRRVLNYCINCGKQIYKQKKYCSNKCQGEFIYKSKVNKWLEGVWDGTQERMGGRSLSRTIRRYILEKFNYTCCHCGWNEINPFTQNIPVEVHHIDGNSENNIEENLEVICPNCHSLTKTYKALNKGNGRHYRRERYKEGKSF